MSWLSSLAVCDMPTWRHSKVSRLSDAASSSLKAQQYVDVLAVVAGKRRSTRLALAGCSWAGCGRQASAGPKGLPRSGSRMLEAVLSISCISASNRPRCPRLKRTRPRAAAVLPARWVAQSAASLSFFSGRTFSLVVAGLALNTVSSFVKGLIPLRAFLAGTAMAVTFSRPGSTKVPAPFLLTDASTVPSRAAMTALTALGSTPDDWARWFTRPVLLNASLIGFIGPVAGFAAFAVVLALPRAGVDFLVAGLAFLAVAMYFHEWLPSDIRGARNSRGITQECVVSKHRRLEGYGADTRRHCAEKRAIPPALRL